ncbi:trypsin-like serine peptidase [Arthrobacter roseus]|uniref:trypsin-like serine peptidase n=1 Tax=Arthrobacter roseus TaxID=136274 RepID=UPI001965CF4E|nr:hypothetical protein [Arthrobacter roseus]MBM7849695.1 hypothetical protein [Arthrobacter roseus]
MNNKKIAGGLLAASATVLAGMFTGMPAQAVGTVDDDAKAPAVVSQAVTAGSSADYWTPERMENAIPGSVLAEQSKAQSSVMAKANQATVQRGEHVTITGNNSDKSKKGNGAATPTAGSENPVDHIGKVFFSLGGSNYVCSGNAVTSNNQSTVSTAGHCLNEGPGAFATKWIFVPAYENGNAPYGEWSAEELFAPTQWVNQGNMAYDTGFAVVAPLNGQSLGEVVGASGLDFNAEREQNYTAYGYPAGAPFDGQTLKSCSGQATPDTISPEFETQGIPCDMTGGSSGGPWFINSDSSGNQNSVNSYGYGSVDAMFGPYWGSVIQDVYSQASSS